MKQYHTSNSRVKQLFLALLFSVTALNIGLFGLGIYSETGRPPGLQQGQLSPCPSSPNCVSSESAPSDEHAIAAIELIPEMGEEPLLVVLHALESMGGKAHYSNPTYMAGSFRSSFYGFVNDMEFRVDTGTGLVHVRSASRVGYLDFGTNRKRVEVLRKRIHEMTTKAVA